MAGTPSAAHPRAFVGADLGVVADQVRAVIEAIQPAVVVTYEDRGGYEHPDHIATHAAVVRALAGLPESRRPTMFAAVTPRSWAIEDRQWVREHVPEQSGLYRPDPDEAYPPSVLPDVAVTHVVTGSPADLQARDDALREHATQVRVFDGYYTLSNNVAARLAAREGYLIWDPSAGRPLAPTTPLTGRHEGLLVMERMPDATD